MDEQEAKGKLPEVGQFAVIYDWNRYMVVGSITKLTAQRAYHPHRWRQADEGFTDLRQVMASGDEDAIRRLCERLTSSKALAADDEARAAHNRHAQRAAKLLAGPAQ